MEGTTKFTQITIPGSGDDGRKIQSPTQPDGRQKKKIVNENVHRFLAIADGNQTDTDPFLSVFYFTFII